MVLVVQVFRQILYAPLHCGLVKCTIFEDNGELGYNNELKLFLRPRVETNFAVYLQIQKTYL